MDEPLRLRPHHGLCIQHFVGKGYSEAFTRNMHKVVARLKAEPDTRIVLTTGTDDVLCRHCPHLSDERCLSGQKPLAYDLKCLELTGFSDGEETSWRAYSRSCRAEILRAKLLEKVCEDCQWLPLCTGLNC